MNTTKRHPRTLQEAFGPYTSRDIHEPKRSLFADFARFFAEAKKPETAESYQESAIAENNSPQIPRTR